MARPTDAGTDAAITEDATRPFFFIELGFDTTIRYCTASTRTWTSQTWLEASVEISFGDNPALEIFNESVALGSVVLVEGTQGRNIDIYQAYREDDGGFTTPMHIFSGEMGPADIGSSVLITCKKHPPLRTPRHYCTSPVFNHMPAAGTRIETPTQIYILEGA